LGLTTVVVMLAIAFARHHWWNATLTVIGLKFGFSVGHGFGYGMVLNLPQYYAAISRR
jgi:hypothetical protein